MLNLYFHLPVVPKNIVTGFIIAGFNFLSRVSKQNYEKLSFLSIKIFACKIAINNSREAWAVIWLKISRYIHTSLVSWCRSLFLFCHTRSIAQIIRLLFLTKKNFVKLSKREMKIRYWERKKLISFLSSTVKQHNLTCQNDGIDV